MPRQSIDRPESSPPASPTAADRPGSGRIAALDGIRGLAILMVLVAHCLTQPIRDAGPVSGTWQHAVWSSTRMFFSGVDLFFVLSGFLICKVVLENRSASNLFKVFYVRRASRILPLYLVAVAAAFLGAATVSKGALWNWLFAQQHPLWSYLTLTQNFLMGLHSQPGGNALAVTWSLAVEEQFYLVLPLCIRFLPAPLLPWLFVSGFPMSYLVRMHWHDGRSYSWAPANADALLLGCLLAWLSLQPGTMAWLRRQAAGLHVFAGALLAGILYINRMPEYFGETAHSWLVAFYATVTLIAISQPASWITRALRWRWLCFLGTVSYGLYLLHRPAQALVHGLIQGSPPRIAAAGDLALFLLTVAIALLASVASYHLFEVHFLRLGRRSRFQ